MRSDYKFSNLLGTVYRQGNLVFTEDGTTVLSPVGNRVSVFDLINNKSFTLSYEHRKDIVCIALNKQGTLLLSVDEDGRAILCNFKARTVLHHFNFKEKVFDLQFSPDGQFFALAAGRFIQVWKTPSLNEDRQFAPFVRHRVYAGHYSDITSISWSGDSRFILSSSKDMTAKIFSLHSEDKEVKMTLAGHRDYVVKAFFDKNQEVIYTVSKDGALFRWEYTERPSDEDEEDEEDNQDNNTEKPMSWRIIAKNFFFADAKLKCACFHPNNNILIVGFSNGEFRIYELPSFTMLQQLSMGQNAVNTISVNSTGEWIVFGSKKLGQMLVYEWQSESYILKQQGHFDSMNALAYSPDGSRIVTASDDGKIKIWDVVSGFCLATFEEHSSSVTQVVFAKRGQVMFSSSLDGTIRAWDLIRFRNFRIFTATERLQFSCLAVDPSGEIVCGGSLDDFKIHVWSVQTSQLLDQLTGHEGPISCLSFGMETNSKSMLASASWDKTIRVWDIFGRTQTSEPFNVVSECVSLAMRHDSKEVAASTLDGQILFWNIEDGKQVLQIDGKRDIIKGRYLEDKFTSANSTRGKFFSTIAYSFDGLSLLAGGNNNSICLYDLPNEVLLRRFTVSQNMKLNGTLQFLNSKKITDAGTNADLIDEDGELSDLEDRQRGDSVLPGSHKGDISARSTRAEVRVTDIEFSPTSNAFAVASTEGLLIYSIDEELIFDPFDLDIDITPETTLEVLNEKDYLTSLIMAFRLNEHYLIHKIYETIKLEDIPLIVSDLPMIYVEKLLKFIGQIANEQPQHIEFNLNWINEILTKHGKYIIKNKYLFNNSIRLIQKFLNRVAKDITKAGFKNEYLQDFLSLEAAGKEAEIDDDDEDVVIEDVAQDSSENEGSDEEGDDDDDEEEGDEEEFGGWFGPGEGKTKAKDNFGSEEDDDEDENEDVDIDME